MNCEIFGTLTTVATSRTGVNNRAVVTPMTNEFPMGFENRQMCSHNIVNCLWLDVTVI